MNFVEKLTEASRENGSLLCVGLDPDPGLIPEGVTVVDFGRAIIEATANLVCAYKFNFAFYEAMDIAGIEALKQTLSYVPGGIPVIGDAKRGDIGNTAKAYAKAIFENYNFDATTVNPYLGFDSIEPFIRYEDKGVFILCRTSNAGATDFQSLSCDVKGINHPLFEVVAQKANRWNTHGNIGLVIGATYPEELKVIRQSHPDMPILIPGVGAQGGDLSSAVRHGVNTEGKLAIINSSRQIIYASREQDFAQAARHAASELRGQINEYLKLFLQA